MKNNSLNKAEEILSIVFHPLLMTTYSVALLFFYADFNYIFGGQIVRILLPVFLLSCVIPALGIFFLRKAIHIESFQQADSTTRIKLLLVIFISYFLLFYHFSQSNIYPWFLGVIAAPALIVLVCLVVSAWAKLSMHMVGFGALIGTVLSVSYNVKHTNPFLLLAFLFLMAGVLATLRLYGNKEKPAQAYIGFVVGLLLSCLCVWCGANFVYLYLLYLNF